jgi:hypothetical protein
VTVQDTTDPVLAGMPANMTVEARGPYGRRQPGAARPPPTPSASPVCRAPRRTAARSDSASRRSPASRGRRLQHRIRDVHRERARQPLPC